MLGLLASGMTTIDFMGKRRYATVVSAVLVVVAIAAVAFVGVNRGLDFTGGALVEVGFAAPPDLAEVRETLAGAGFAEAVVQNYGAETDVMIRLPPVAGSEARAGEAAGAEREQSALGDDIIAALARTLPNVALRRSEFVGPTVGEELTESGGLALLVALLVVMVYIMWRFTGKFAIGAVTALVHDVLIVVGAFAVFRWTFNLPELAALLAVIGYSLNDTIVVSDRIRENFRTMRRGSPTEIVNRSLNQTLGRTLVTSLTTLLVLGALLFAGGEQIAGFATALAIGVVVGTYSSIYIAANALLALGVSRQDMALPEKEGVGDVP